MKNIIVSIFVFIISLIIATALGFSSGSTLSFNNPFILLTLLAFIVQWIAFIPAAILKTEKFYDLTGSITYLASITLALFSFSQLTTRSIIITSLVCLWSLRLGLFLFFRIAKSGKDSRFDEIKKSPTRFFVAWNLQGLWVCITSCAAWAGVSLSSQNPELGLISWAGVFIWIIGFSIEVIADRQKSRFKVQESNQGKFIQSGLWSLCRHPNYAGEILLWTGMFIISSEALVGSTWLTIISPLFVYLLLTKISGVPLLTEQAKKRWGDDIRWKKYFKNTPALFPRLFNNK